MTDALIALHQQAAQILEQRKAALDSKIPTDVFDYSKNRETYVAVLEQIVNLQTKFYE